MAIRRAGRTAGGLTITVDEELVPRAKQYARERGVSLSSMIEDALERITSTGGPAGTFSARWRGSMALCQRDGERYRALVDKYG